MTRPDLDVCASRDLSVFIHTVYRRPIILSQSICRCVWVSKVLVLTSDVVDIDVDENSQDGRKCRVDWLVG